jgi:hypothetical protein
VLGVTNNCRRRAVESIRVRALDPPTRVVGGRPDAAGRPVGGGAPRSRRPWMRPNAEAEQPKRSAAGRSGTRVATSRHGSCRTSSTGITPGQHLWPSNWHPQCTPTAADGERSTRHAWACPR